MSAPTVKVGVFGCGGRMGRELIRAITDDSRTALSSASEHTGSDAIGTDAGLLAGLGANQISVSEGSEALLKAAQVVIDFTTPTATESLVAAAATQGTALVIGTTGLSDAQEQAIAEAAKTIPVVKAPNMSVGVNVLLRLVNEATRLLGPDYDLEVVEAHHRHKQDAPSGTALRLAHELAAASPELGSFDARACYGRKGVDPRTEHQIGIHTVRGGDIVGDHTVMFCTEGERVELVHKASSRQTFARGAVRAAIWVATQPAGLYDMQDVLGLK